jgi:hypothetical protein
MLTITDNIDSITFMKTQNAIDLELKLNVTQYGRIWSAIGDVLFDWETQKVGALDNYVVTSEQLSYLKMLQKKPTYREVPKLSTPL